MVRIFMDMSLYDNSSGVSVLVEYLLTLAVTVVLFSILLLTSNNMLSSAENVALREEFDIISNDIANRISSFSSEIAINNGSSVNSTTIEQNGVVYFELPELVRGKQYKVDVSEVNSGTSNCGTITVTYVSNSNIHSTTTFISKINVHSSSFYSQPGRYAISYKNSYIDIMGA